MNDQLLSAKDLHKTYKTGTKEVRAVNGVSVEIKKGLSVAMVGPSGAGKSTLMHILGGLDKPTSGKVFLGDTDMYRLADKQRAEVRNGRIGFVFQFYHLLPEFTALENVMLPTLINKRERRNARQRLEDKARHLLKIVGLEHRTGHLPSHLSGGESQRVAIARALANEPDILLCDEPTGNLDSKNSESIYELLLGLKSKNNTTLVIVSHDEKIASKVDRVIYLKDGKLA
ncbi:MAG: ABC transporter ATP-binding protein [Candidatus Omnitrophota bacterium]|jgi:lipoprotein-releasing system ATP-binding protein